MIGDLIASGDYVGAAVATVLCSGIVIFLLWQLGVEGESRFLAELRRKDEEGARVQAIQERERIAQFVRGDITVPPQER